MSDKVSNEERIANEAREIWDSNARASFLKKACGGDEELLTRVRALLKAHDESDALRTWSDAEYSGEENPPSSGAARDDTTMMDDGSVESPTEREGDRIGRYKLLQQIGEGGFGVVFMAEQLEPVKRRVALKVIKLGMDTKQFVARFEAERQALAMMDHPNIAKALDAGATVTGRPYFVMELVRGVRVTDFCNEAKFTLKERLELFTQICAAVQHAHQKGVIHRDIKPSNILITEQDGVGIPKVIDFGIAKAVDQQLTDKTLFTQFEQFLGTPAYTSPEQAGMSGVDVDTRSDIYSLGILLYELLTGAPPFDSKVLMSGGFDEMRRTIQEDEPARPSTRLGSTEQSRVSTVAAQRQTEAPHLFSQLQGDLDWIVMKAIEKDRSRRYETANGLALDVRRYLNNEPVLARPPTAGYRFHKMVRRNRAAVATAAAITIALLVGLVTAIWQAIRATNAETEQAIQTLQVGVERDRAKQAEKDARERAAEANEARLRAEAATKLAETERRRAEREASKSSQVARVLQEMIEGATQQGFEGSASG